MAKINKCFIINYIRYFCAFLVILSPVSILNSSECVCYFCNEDDFPEDYLDYSLLGEYEKGFQEFDILSENEDHEKGILRKWCRKVKKWFRKNLYKTLTKFIHVSIFTNGETAAYEIAHMKIKIDKKVHHTGHIEEVLSKFERQTNDPAYEDMNLFTDRIRYYYTHPNATPQLYFNGHPITNLNLEVSTEFEKRVHYDEDQLKNIPTRALMGGVGVASGVLVCAIPLPGCRSLGIFLISAGSQQIYEGYMQKYEEDIRAGRRAKMPSKQLLMKYQIEANSNF